MNQLTPELQQQWQRAGFTAPTPIQIATHPLITDGQSLVATAPTGTGKTLAYLLPLLPKIQPQGGWQLLILVPSQELAQQIGRVVQLWATPCRLSSVVLAGGANRNRQIDKLKSKPEIIVATPGRLSELSEQSRKLKYHQIQAIVLDEADHLLVDEHIDVVRRLVGRAPASRQLLFFSATSSERLQQIERWFSTTVQTVSISATQSEQNTQHTYIQTPNRKRSEVLRALSHVADWRALVFVSNIATADMLYQKLRYEKVPVALVHSELSATERKRAIEQFTHQKVCYLVTTDVAARGLDLPQLPCVIQYDLPLDAITYTHRSGRTGRMGAAGLVVSLVNERSVRTLKQLVAPGTVLQEKIVYAQQFIDAPVAAPRTNKRRRTKTQTAKQHKHNKS